MVAHHVLVDFEIAKHPREFGNHLANRLVRVFRLRPEPRCVHRPLVDGHKLRVAAPTVSSEFPNPHGLWGRACALQRAYPLFDALIAHGVRNYPRISGNATSGVTCA